MNQKQDGSALCRKAPELLCPAGSPLALDAAIEGGADAVYLGSGDFNARMNAANFTNIELREGVRRAHSFGAKVYLTLNTLVYDREINAYLQAAYEAQAAGVDALIVADLGGAALLHRAFPALPLHASTQMSAHNAAAGELLHALGFSRMVVARELSLEQLRAVTAVSPIEVEAFIHGALCVCHSGQCLFSSLVGGRSGNRGQCAQPCRLPYRTVGRTANEYPLSLKDLSLAQHVPTLCTSGIASLKIEGRMKSPEYVYTVTRIWRTLLDEERSATADEMEQLAQAFSRGGFTDGYFTGRIGRSMLGVRSEQDKQDGRALSPFRGLAKKIPLDMHVTLQPDTKATLTVKAPWGDCVATGDAPQRAINAPLTKEHVARQMNRLGNTPYLCRALTVSMDEPVMLPLSSLNALRRTALDGVEALLEPRNDIPTCPTYRRPQASTPPSRAAERSARFATPEQLTPAAQHYFDVCYLPLEMMQAVDDDTLTKWQQNTQIGVVVPPIILETECAEVQGWLTIAHARGIRRALVGNLGHLAMVKKAGFSIINGDFRLNITNAESADVVRTMGIACPILSPELSLPQIRDIAGDTAVIVYGRIPLMILEKCIIRDSADCNTCQRGKATLLDRRGTAFPVRRVYRHRNVIYNSLPTDMTDREAALQSAHIHNRHFIFSVEAPAAVDAVIARQARHLPADGPVRRIQA